MNSTRTTNILLSVLLLLSGGNYLKTDSLESDLNKVRRYSLDAAAECSDIDIDEVIYTLDQVDAELDNIAFQTQMTQSMCSM